MAKKAIGYIGMGYGRNPDSGKGTTVGLLGVRYSKDRKPRFDVIVRTWGGRKTVISEKKETLKNCYLGRMLRAAHLAGEVLEQSRTRIAK